MHCGAWWFQLPLLLSPTVVRPVDEDALRNPQRNLHQTVGGNFTEPNSIETKHQSINFDTKKLVDLPNFGNFEESLEK